MVLEEVAIKLYRYGSLILVCLNCCNLHKAWVMSNYQLTVPFNNGSPLFRNLKILMVVCGCATQASLEIFATVKAC